MEDIEVIARIVLRQPEVLITLAVGVLVLAPASTTWARRLRWSRGRTLSAGLSGASLALVPATTLARDHALVAWDRSCSMQPSLSLSSPEALLNALLFAPAAFFGVLATRRMAPVLVAVLGCSVAIEAVQLVTAMGTCQTADVTRNLAGAVVPAVVAALLLRTFRRRVLNPVRPGDPATFSR